MVDKRSGRFLSSDEVKNMVGLPGILGFSKDKRVLIVDDFLYLVLDPSGGM